VKVRFFLIILGIDPGIVVTGYGIIQNTGRISKLLVCGCIKPDRKLPFEKRLSRIYTGMLEVVSDVSPDEVALESVFYGPNVQTLVKMSHARGVIMLALANSNLSIFEYSPREVKKAVVGRGGASKEQVQFMIRRLIKADQIPEALDVSDSIAVALCHLHRSKSQLKIPPKKGNLEEKLRAVGAFSRQSSGLREKLREVVGDEAGTLKIKRKG